MVRSIITASVEHELASKVIEEAELKNTTVSELIRNILKHRYEKDINNFKTIDIED